MVSITIFSDRFHITVIKLVFELSTVLRTRRVMVKWTWTVLTSSYWPLEGTPYTVLRTRITHGGLKLGPATWGINSGHIKSSVATRDNVTTVFYWI